MPRIRDRVIWDQIKSVTPKRLIKALKKDGWEEEDTRGATRAFVKFTANGHSDTRKRVVIHYHPRKTYQPKLLKALIEEIGWTPEDLLRLKLIKQLPKPKDGSS